MCDKVNEVFDLAKNLNQTNQTGYLEYIGKSIFKFKKDISNLSDDDLNELISAIKKIEFDIIRNSENLAILLDDMIEKVKVKNGSKS